MPAISRFSDTESTKRSENSSNTRWTPPAMLCEVKIFASPTQVACASERIIHKIKYFYKTKKRDMYLYRQIQMQLDQ